MVSTPKPNGFADHYPYEKWLFHWEYTPFSDIPNWIKLTHWGDLGSTKNHFDQKIGRWLVCERWIKCREKYDLLQGFVKQDSVHHGEKCNTRSMSMVLAILWLGFSPNLSNFYRGWELSHFGNIGHHLIVAIKDHIPNGWVMFNGDI